jgi:hypothetical protein
MIRRLVRVLLCAICVSGVWSQEAGEPIGDSEAEEYAGDLLADAEAADTGVFSFSGVFFSRAIAAAGWILPSDIGSFDDSLAFGGYAEARASFEVRAAPMEFSEVCALAYFAFPGESPDAFDWTSIRLGKLYGSFLAFDSLYVTVGKFQEKWGRGIFLTPGDFTNGIEDGFGLKINIPFGVSTIQAVGFGNETSFADPSAPSFAEIEFAAKAETVLYSFLLGVSCYFKKDAPGKLSISLKSGIEGIDVYAEGFGFISQAGVEFGALAGIYWLNLDPKVLVAFEWSWDGRVLAGHDVALVAAWSKPFGAPFRAAIRWDHAFHDGSGSFVPAVEFFPGDGLTISFGMPWYYGTRNGIHEMENEDPAGRRFFAFLGVTYTLSF